MNTQSVATLKKYFIDLNGELEQTDQESYEAWLKAEGKKFNLGPFELEKSGWKHHISAFFKGDLNANEEVLPFYVFWSESATAEHAKNIAADEYFIEPDGVECFATFEEAEARYNELVGGLKEPVLEWVRPN